MPRAAHQNQCRSAHHRVPRASGSHSLLASRAEAIPGMACVRPAFAKAMMGGALCLGVLGGSPPAYADTTPLAGGAVSGNAFPEGVSTGPLPAHVIPQSELGVSGPMSRPDTDYRLVSYQNAYAPDSSTYTTLQSIEIGDADDLEDYGNVEVEFDPTHESLVFHYVDAVRDGQRRNLLEGADMVAYATQDSATARVYDATVEVALLARGLRVGDRLDIAFSVQGKLPSLVPHTSPSASTGWSAPVEHVVHRHTFAPGMEVTSAALAGSVEPERIETAQGTVFEVRLRDTPRYSRADNMPTWARAYPKVIYSTFVDWGAVGDQFASHYVLEDADRIAVAPILREILDGLDAADPQTDAEGAVLAALQWVQDNIRYVATNMGDGGYVPRRPATVLERGFGDCKDVTLLTLALLDSFGEELGLDVPAVPVLVSTDKRDGVFRDPLPFVGFNHVLVVADVGGESFVLDATGRRQIGGLRDQYAPPYGKGIAMRPSASRVEILPHRMPDWMRDLSLDYDVSAGFTTTGVQSEDTQAEDTRSGDTRSGDTQAVGTLSLVERHRGPSANRLHRRLNESGRAAIVGDFADWLAKHHPSIDPTPESFEVDVDEDAAEVVVRAVFYIREPWRELADRPEYVGFDYGALDVYDALPGNGTDGRDQPLAIRHPVAIRQRVSVKLPGVDWDLGDRNVSHTTDAFDFTAEETFDAASSTLREVYTYRTKADHIAVADYPDAMAAIRQSNRESRANLQYIPRDATTDSEMSLWSASILGVLAAALGVVGIARSRQPRTRVPEQNPKP